MDRRNALKNLGLISGGLILLPSCDFSKENVTRVMNNLQVTESQEALLKSLVSAVIPESEVPGALSLGIDEFVWVMVDDCLTKDRQEAFMSGLSGFSESYREFSGESFDTSSPSDRSTNLNKMTKGETTPAETRISSDVQEFLETSKSFSILGFMRSEYLMTEVMPYSLVPGKYPSCRTIDPNGKINIYG